MKLRIGLIIQVRLCVSFIFVISIAIAASGCTSEAVKRAETLVKVTSTPHFKSSYDLMNTGVIQHLDRDYTYDIIPSELVGGLLFQGIHRPPKGTALKIELLEPATIYFFFHHTVDGGYTKIFKTLNSWKKCNTAPQYDIDNGDHGLKMTMYKMEANKGIYHIPPTQEDRACFNIVFVYDDQVL